MADLFFLEAHVLVGQEKSIVDTHPLTRLGTVTGLLLVLLFAAQTRVLHAQSLLPALFVTDHIATAPEFGNFASIKSFTINIDGTLTPVGTYFTNDYPYELALSPSGRFLAVGHASSLANEDLIVFQVNPDASLTMYAVATVHGSPFEIAWLNDHTLVLLETAEGDCGVWTYDFESDAPQPQKIVPIDDARTGDFSSHLALNPTKPVVYVPDSPLFGTSRLFTFQIETDRTLTQLQELTVGSYALDIAITPDGKYLYMVSGGGSDTIQGFEIDAIDGTLTPLFFSPFGTPDGPPSQIAILSSGTLAVVFHGATEAVRSFTISPDDGTLFDSGFGFNIGGSGIFEAIQLYNNTLYVTRNADGTTPAGILAYNILIDGSFTPVADGDIIPAGTRPYFMETWNPRTSRPGDINGDGAVDQLDIPPFVAALLGSPIEPVHTARSDLNQDETTDGLDAQPFVNALLSPEVTGACCFTDLPCEVVTEDECVNTLGGIYAGDGLPCGVCPPLPAPVVDSAFGNGPPFCNTGPFTQYSFLIFGQNFSSQADVRLVSDTLPDILPTGFDIFDPGTIGADFEFAGVPSGTYHVRVTNPDGQFSDATDLVEIAPCP